MRNRFNFYNFCVCVSTNRVIDKSTKFFCFSSSINTIKKMKIFLLKLISGFAILLSIVIVKWHNRFQFIHMWRYPVENNHVVREHGTFDWKMLKSLSTIFIFSMTINESIMRIMTSKIDKISDILFEKFWTI